MSLTEQIQHVIDYANRTGCPDAADWIIRTFFRHNSGEYITRREEISNE